MKKVIESFISIMLCTYIIAVCLICLSELDTWQDGTIAITLTFGSAYLISLLLNKLLGLRLKIIGEVLSLLSGPLLIVGVFCCVALLEPWPVKIVGMFLWVGIIFYLPSCINRD